MKLIDANLLIYAINRDSPLHTRARTWLEATLSGDETIVLPWIVILGFLRVMTSRRIFSRPLTPENAIAIVDSWLMRPNVVSEATGGDHWQELRRQLLVTGTAGNLTTDAHLAACAISSGADLCSADADFARFSGVRWVNPLAG